MDLLRVQRADVRVLGRQWVNLRAKQRPIKWLRHQDVRAFPEADRPGAPLPCSPQQQSTIRPTRRAPPPMNRQRRSSDRTGPTLARAAAASSSGEPGSARWTCAARGRTTHRIPGGCMLIMCDQPGAFASGNSCAAPRDRHWRRTVPDHRPTRTCWRGWRAPRTRCPAVNRTAVLVMARLANLRIGRRCSTTRNPPVILVAVPPDAGDGRLGGPAPQAGSDAVVPPPSWLGRRAQRRAPAGALPGLVRA